MKVMIIKTILALGFWAAISPVFSQCDILNRVTPDGSMQYYIEPVNFYWTEKKSLKGGIVTDKENYFLELYPLPFPAKEVGKKLKSDIILKLSDGKTYWLKHFDTHYEDNDSVMKMLYLIRQEDREPLLNFEVIEADIDMMGEEGIRSYVFKLHKAALKDQLTCFLKEEKEGKEKK